MSLSSRLRLFERSFWLPPLSEALVLESPVVDDREPPCWFRNRARGERIIGLEPHTKKELSSVVTMLASSVHVTVCSENTINQYGAILHYCITSRIDRENYSRNEDTLHIGTFALTIGLVGSPLMTDGIFLGSKFPVQS